MRKRRPGVYRISSGLTDMFRDLTICVFGWGYSGAHISLGKVMVTKWCLRMRTFCFTRLALDFGWIEINPS